MNVGSAQLRGRPVSKRSHGQRKERDGQSASVGSCFSLGIYKRSQGRIARQVTFAALAIGVAAGGLAAERVLGKRTTSLAAGRLAGAAGRRVGLWLAFRLVNMPAFADFLIAVEAEMNKVSWPTRGELFRSFDGGDFLIFFLALRAVRLRLVLEQSAASVENRGVTANDRSVAIKRLRRQSNRTASIGRALQETEA